MLNATNLTSHERFNATHDSSISEVARTPVDIRVVDLTVATPMHHQCRQSRSVIYSPDDVTYVGSRQTGNARRPLCEWTVPATKTGPSVVAREMAGSGSAATGQKCNYCLTAVASQRLNRLDCCGFAVCPTCLAYLWDAKRDVRLGSVTKGLCPNCRRFTFTRL